MSGMFDSKADKASRKLARTQKEEKAKKKTRTIAITVISVLLVFSAVAILINSSFIRRVLPVVSIDGVNFTTTEFEFFFNNEYMEYINFLSQFQGMGGTMPDMNRPLSTQIYNHETGETWADLITNATFNKMSNLVSLYNAGKASGFVMSEEQAEEIENDIAMVEIQAMINRFPSTDSFLQQMFGTSMNERTYRRIQEFVTFANSYNEHIRESFEYSAETLAGYYADSRNQLDVFTYRQFMIFFDLPFEADFDDETDFENAVTEATDNARSSAAAIASGISSENDLINAAFIYSELYSDPESTLRLNQGSRLEADTADWLLDDARVYGDTTLIESEQGINIVFFVSRDDNNYRTAGMRQILIMREQINPEDYPGGETDPDYLAALEQAENDARDRAEYVHLLFTAAGGTEDALIGLMDEHSDDNTAGGYYSNISKFPYQSTHLNTMKVVQEIEDWLFDANRVVGDSELIYTSAFGYHLIYFTGLGDLFFELMADDRMRTRDHTAWLDGLTPGEPVKRPAFILVHV